MLNANKWDDSRVHYKSWASDIEEGALEQIHNLTKLPFVFHHVAMMPDCHKGYGMPIGGVLATEGVVVPNSVGVDIGCGVVSTQLPITYDELNNKHNGEQFLKAVLGKIREVIPTGFEHHKEPQENNLVMPNPMSEILERVEGKIDYQIGTLGGGNHFIEIQKGDDGFICVMVHSGSRNLGYRVADYYNKKAVYNNEKWFSMVPKEWELAFLPVGKNGDPLGGMYLTDMKFCLAFAKENRRIMIERIIDIILKEAGIGDEESSLYNILDVHHNYVSIENHFGKNVWVHRKGAIRVRDGERGIVPGSQGTNSYIVEGRGNPESFMSCSHGAGRVMSRTKARNTIDLNKEKEMLDKLGIIHAIRNQDDLDEAPSAYKNIDEVMENQKDLCMPITELTPLAVIKGE